MGRLVCRSQVARLFDLAAVADSLEVDLDAGTDKSR